MRKIKKIEKQNNLKKQKNKKKIKPQAFYSKKTIL